MNSLSAKTGDPKLSGQTSPLSRRVAHGEFEFELEVVWHDADWPSWFPGRKQAGWMWHAKAPEGRSGFRSCLPRETQEEALQAGLEAIQRLGPRVGT